MLFQATEETKRNMAAGNEEMFRAIREFDKSKLRPVVRECLSR